MNGGGGIVHKRGGDGRVGVQGAVTGSTYALLQVRKNVALVRLKYDAFLAREVVEHYHTGTIASGVALD